MGWDTVFIFLHDRHPSRRLPMCADLHTWSSIFCGALEWGGIRSSFSFTTVTPRSGSHVCRGAHLVEHLLWGAWMGGMRSPFLFTTVTPRACSQCVEVCTHGRASFVGRLGGWDTVVISLHDRHPSRLLPLCAGPHTWSSIFCGALGWGGIRSSFFLTTVTPRAGSGSQCVQICTLGRALLRGAWMGWIQSSFFFTTVTPRARSQCVQICTLGRALW